MRRVAQGYNDLFAIAAFALLFTLAALSNSFSQSNSPRPTGLKPMTEQELQQFFGQYGKPVGEVTLNDLGYERMSQGKRGMLIESATLTAEMALPVKVDNSKLKYFPPIRTQGELASCVGFSIAYYHLSYYFAKKYDWDQKSGGDDIKFSPKWIYNFINGGENQYTSWHDAYRILEKYGCATLEDFPYDTFATPETSFREWCDNPAAWRKALDYRVENRVAYLHYSEQTTNEFRRKMKELLVNGEILIIQGYGSSWRYMPIGDNPNSTHDNTEEGKMAVYYSDGSQGSHSMNVVGYNDDIWVDINQNGTLDPDELGAFRIANSYGVTFKDEGFTWVAYDAIKQSSLIPGAPNPEFRTPAIVQSTWYIRPREDIETRLLAEVTLNHAVRNEIGLRIDVSGLDNTDEFNTRIFMENGPYSFDGTETARPYTFIFDLSDYICRNMIDNSHVESWNLRLQDMGVGHDVTIESFKLIDVQGGSEEYVAANLPQDFHNQEKIYTLNLQRGDSYINYPPMVFAGNYYDASFPETAITLSGSVLDDGLPLGNPITYSWSQLSGPVEVIFEDPTALSTKAFLNFEGDYVFRLTASDGDKQSYNDAFAYYSRYNEPTYIVFEDDFETDKGWLVNPGGTDNATKGMWERANPEETSHNGFIYQLNTTVSGTNALVTGPLLGSGVGSHDVDGGITSIRSPQISLPVSNDLILGFSYYLAHFSNAGPEDYLRVSVSGTSNQVIFEENGVSSTERGAQWKRVEFDLSSFAGQDVSIFIEIGDIGDATLLEAGIDDLDIILSETGPCIDPCEAPTGLYATNIGSQSADIHWDEVPGAESYIIKYQETYSSYWSMVGETENTMAPVHTLYPGTEYRFVIKARCGDDCESKNSQELIFNTSEFSCPTTGNIVSNDLTETSVTIDWDPVTEASNFLYRIRIAGMAWDNWIDNGPANYTMLEELNPNTDYEFQVQSICELGESAPSEAYSFRTLSEGTAPTIVSQPQNVTVNVGEEVTLCVTAAGATPFTYQWYKNSELQSGADGRCYTALDPATLADNGTHCYVVVSNAYGSVTSFLATITVQDVSTNIIDADFNVDAESFSEVKDLFRGTSQPNYVRAEHTSSQGFNSSGGLQVNIGGIDDDDIVNMSGGFQKYFFLSSPKTVTLSLRYNMIISSEYEDYEYSEVLVAMDGNLVGNGSNDYVNRLVGNNNGGPNDETGWQTFTKSLGTLPSGSHMLQIGGFNNGKTLANESTTIFFDDVILSTETTGEIPAITTHPQDQIVSEGSNVTFCVSASGSTPLSYVWYRDGAVIPGATSSCYTLNSVDASDDGALIYAEVSNSYGTAVSATATLAVTPNSPILLEENFNSNAGSFSYHDDVFRSTNQPAYASGTYTSNEGFSGSGGLKVNIGGVNPDDILNMSGGWQTTFTVDETAEVTVALRYNLVLSSEYETHEYSEALLAVDGVLYGVEGNDYLARISGNNNGGTEDQTFWQYVEINCGFLEPGTHTLTIGGYNSEKTYTNEETRVYIDDVVVSK